MTSGTSRQHPFLEVQQHIEGRGTQLKTLNIDFWVGGVEKSESVRYVRLTASYVGIGTDAGGDYQIYQMEVTFSSYYEAAVRGLKVAFDAWLRPRPPLRQPQPWPLSSYSGAARGLPSPWWKPVLHNIRDNLLSNVLWLVLLAVVLLALAWLGLR